MVKALAVLFLKHGFGVVQRQERYDIIEVDVADRQAFEVLLLAAVGPNLNADKQWYGEGVIVVHEFVTVNVIVIEGTSPRSFSA